MGIFPIDDLTTAAAVTWAETIAAASDACQQALTEKFYDWPNATLRQNGQLVPAGKRDIIDTKTLYNSHSTQGEDLVWSAEYADLNHDGGMEGRRYHHARPWTEYGIKGDSTDDANWQREEAILDLPRFFAAGMERKLGAIEPDGDG